MSCYIYRGVNYSKKEIINLFKETEDVSREDQILMFQALAQNFNTELSTLGIDLSSEVYAQRATETDAEYNNRLLKEVEAYVVSPIIAEKLEALKQENPSLWQQIIDFIKNLTDYLKNQLGLQDYKGNIMDMSKDEYLNALGVSILKDDYSTEAEKYYTRNADRLPLTLSVFQRPEFVKMQGKQVNPITVLNSLNQSGIKQIEKDLIKQIINNNFQGQNKIDYDELEATVRANIIPLKTELSFDFSDYGVRNLGLYPMYAGTYILNSPVMHGKRGHFFNKYETTTYAPEYEIIKITQNLFGAKKIQKEEYDSDDNIYFSGVKEDVEQFVLQENSKYLTEINFKQKGFSIQKRQTTWTLIDSDNKEVESTDLGWLPESRRTDEAATNLLLEEYNRYKLNTGLYSHYRSFFIDDKMAIVEIQSDIFQKNMFDIKANLKDDKFNKQFTASKKAWFERTIREIVKNAIKEKRSTVLFPTPYITAIIEKYVTKPGEDNVVPYKVLKSILKDIISVGDIVESKDRGGSPVQVIESTKDTFVVEERGMLNTYKQPLKYGEITEEDFTNSINEVLTPKEKTVVDNYKNIESFLKREYGTNFVSRFKDEENNSWVKLDIQPQEINQPVVAFQVVRNNPQQVIESAGLDSIALASGFKFVEETTDEQEEQYIKDFDSCRT